MKLAKQQIDAIREHTPSELKGKQVSLLDELGHYRKPSANWSYRAGWTRDGILVVTVFGEVI